MMQKTILLIIFTIISGFLHSQSVFLQADSLFYCGKYRDAYLAYERIIFEKPDKITRTIAELSKIECYKHLERYNEAIEELAAVHIWGLPDSLVFQVKYQSALCMYLNGNAQEANTQIVQIQTFIRDTTYTKQLQLLKILILNELKNWDEAEILAKLHIAENVHDNNFKNIALHEIDSMYSKNNRPRIKSLKTARILSLALPGAGQVYAGKYLEGFFSFALHAACLFFGAHQFYYKYYFTGYFVGLGLLQKFYFGGANRADKLIEIYNLQHIANYNQQLKNILLKGN